MVGFEPSILRSDEPQTYSLNYGGTGTVPQTRFFFKIGLLSPVIHLCDFNADSFHTCNT